MPPDRCLRVASSSAGCSPVPGCLQPGTGWSVLGGGQGTTRRQPWHLGKSMQVTSSSLHGHIAHPWQPCPPSSPLRGSATTRRSLAIFLPQDRARRRSAKARRGAWTLPQCRPSPSTRGQALQSEKELLLWAGERTCGPPGIPESRSHLSPLRGGPPNFLPSARPLCIHTFWGNLSMGSSPPSTLRASGVGRWVVGELSGAGPQGRRDG